jgi:hypothetical protein
MAANEIDKLLELMADTVHQANIEPVTQTALLAGLFQSYSKDVARLCTLKEEEGIALEELVLRFQTLAKPGAYNKKDAISLRYFCDIACGELKRAYGDGGGKVASGGAGGRGPGKKKAGAEQGQKKGKPKSNEGKPSAGAVADANTKLPVAACAGSPPISGPALSTSLSTSSILSSSSSSSSFSSRSRAPGWELVTTDCSDLCFDDSLLQYMDVGMAERDRILSNTYTVLRSATTVIKFMDKSRADKRYSVETVSTEPTTESDLPSSPITNAIHMHMHTQVRSLVAGEIPTSIALSDESK